MSEIHGINREKCNVIPMINLTISGMGIMFSNRLHQKGFVVK